MKATAALPSQWRSVRLIAVTAVISGASMILLYMWVAG
jgi:hypothetical protein